MTLAELDLVLPPNVASGSYILKPPLIKKSRLTSVDRGGVGKELSDGYVINFSIGCMFGCNFCYVPAIQRAYDRRVGTLTVDNDWGYYFAVPKNLAEVIEVTHWTNWKGKEVMLSSTHDAYLPQLYKWTRKILERALPAGVKFCIQTRSPLVEQDFSYMEAFRDQIRLQVSVATLNNALSRMIEPRVVPPMRRLEILKHAKEHTLETGIIIAPVFPRVKLRPDLESDLDQIATVLSEIRPDHIYGESLHKRGTNFTYIEKAIGEKVVIDGLDKEAETLFHSALGAHNLIGRWWVEK